MLQTNRLEFGADMPLTSESVQISASVGFDGVNRRADVFTIQQLINSRVPIPREPLQTDGTGYKQAGIFAISQILKQNMAMHIPDGRVDPGVINLRLPIPLKPLTANGRCEQATIFAIREIQWRSMGMRMPDGRVDPGGATFRFLTGTPTTSAHRVPVKGSIQIAWGAMVSASFKTKAIKIAANLGVDPDFLMSAMAFETAETFSPSVRNKKSSATGLIQFMPSTAAALGTTTQKLAHMSDVDQLDYVESYFKPHTNKLKTIEDVYMAILWPKAIGKPNSFVLFNTPQQYQPNSGLDANHDGKVTKEEAAAKVKEKLIKGKSEGFCG